MLEPPLTPLKDHHGRGVNPITKVSEIAMLPKPVIDYPVHLGIHSPRGPGRDGSKSSA